MRDSSSAHNTQIAPLFTPSYIPGMITPGAAQTGQNGLTFTGYDDIIKAVREYAIITAALRSSCLFLILPGVYSNMKTVKQLAAEQNTTKQIIHRIIKRERIETIQNGNRLLIDSEAEAAILQALQLHEAANRTAPDDSRTIQNDSERFENNSKRFKTIQNDSTPAGSLEDPPENEQQREQLEQLREALEDLRKENQQLTAEKAGLTSQVELLREQLEELRTDKQYLKEHIDRLTAALQAAQALHGIEKQQAVIEAAAPASAQSERQLQKQQRTRPAPAAGTGRQSERRTVSPDPKQKQQRNRLQTIIQGIKDRLK